MATWCEELTHWKRPWCWEILKAGGEGDDRGWDGWKASLTQWTWVWVNSRSWWFTGRPGVLQSMGSQRVGHAWVTELNWTESGMGMLNLFLSSYVFSKIYIESQSFGAKQLLPGKVKSFWNLNICEYVNKKKKNTSWQLTPEAFYFLLSSNCTKKRKKISWWKVERAASSNFFLLFTSLWPFLNLSICGALWSRKRLNFKISQMNI